MVGGYVVATGGIALDLKARANAALVRGSSNRGRLTRCPGGVARNIAENLARLGTPVHLVGAVGDDPLGAELVEQTRAAGVTVVPVGQRELTGTYTAMLDENGELVAGVADLSATEGLAPDDLAVMLPLVAGAALLVADANLPVSFLHNLVVRARDARVPVVLDPVSVPKADRVSAVLDPRHPVLLVSPNRDELGALTGHSTGSRSELVGAARRLCAMGAENVWVRLGADGSLLVPRADEPVPLGAHKVTVVDVTGGGDAMLAGLIHRWLLGDPLAEAAAYGQAVAALTVAREETVRPDLGPDLVEAQLARPVGRWR
ncbi:carbohydrate kinase family protein [Nocardioides sp.]|uniref:carbohydrate kinase family protein n=1 Tax=Nocardioides sp. TaxID=35761 RepID=UPI003528F2B4